MTEPRMGTDRSERARNRTPEGGSWTWRNRLACWLVGHSRSDAPTFTHGVTGTKVWLCQRCNDFAKCRDTNGEWFDTFDDYFAANKARLRAMYAGASTPDLAKP